MTSVRINNDESNDGTVSHNTATISSNLTRSSPTALMSHDGIMAPDGDINEDICPLMRLSAEIRNRIFAYAVVEEKPINVYTSRRVVPESEHFIPYKIEARTFPGSPALSRTCKQFRAEVVPVYYALNTFAIFLHPNIGKQIDSWVWSMRSQDPRDKSTSESRSEHRHTPNNPETSDHVCNVNLIFAAVDTTDLGDDEKDVVTEVRKNPDSTDYTLYTHEGYIDWNICDCKVIHTAYVMPMLDFLSWFEDKCFPIIAGREYEATLKRYNKCDECKSYRTNLNLLDNPRQSRFTLDNSLPPDGYGWCPDRYC